MTPGSVKQLHSILKLMEPPLCGIVVILVSSSTILIFSISLVEVIFPIVSFNTLPLSIVKLLIPFVIRVPFESSNHIPEVVEDVFVVKVLLVEKNVE